MFTDIFNSKIIAFIWTTIAYLINSIPTAKARPNDMSAGVDFQFFEIDSEITDLMWCG